MSRLGSPHAPPRIRGLGGGLCQPPARQLAKGLHRLCLPPSTAQPPNIVRIGQSVPNVSKVGDPAWRAISNICTIATILNDFDEEACKTDSIWRKREGHGAKLRHFGNSLRHIRNKVSILREQILDLSGTDPLPKPTQICRREGCPKSLNSLTYSLTL